MTPAQPQYLYGMVDDRADAHDFQESPPILGIAAAVGGYKVHPFAQVVYVSEVSGLTHSLSICMAGAVVCVCVCVCCCSQVLRLYSGYLVMPRPAPSNPHCYALGHCPPCLPRAPRSKSAHSIFVTTSPFGGNVLVEIVVISFLAETMKQAMLTGTIAYLHLTLVQCSNTTVNSLLLICLRSILVCCYGIVWHCSDVGAPAGTGTAPTVHLQRCSH